MPRVEPPDPAVLALAERALPHWELEGSRLEPFSVSENVVFRVESPGGEHFALRVHRDGYHSLQELESEPLWTNALARVGIDVPEALPARDGCHYVRVPGPGPGETRHVGLVRWIDGVTLEEFIEQAGDDEKVARHFERLGALQARMHAQSAGWSPPAKFHRHAWDADGLLGEAPFWGRFWESPLASVAQQQRLRAIRDALFEELRELGCDPSIYGMIHADLQPANLLVDDDHLYVIDFDDAGFGWYVFDMAVTVYEFEAGRAGFSIALEALLRGYRSVRDPEPDLLERLPRFLLMRALMIVGWATARPEVGVEPLVPLVIRDAFERADTLGLG